MHVLTKTYYVPGDIIDGKLHDTNVWELLL